MKSSEVYPKGSSSEGFRLKNTIPGQFTLHSSIGNQNLLTCFYGPHKIPNQVYYSIKGEGTLLGVKNLLPNRVIEFSFNDAAYSFVSDDNGELFFNEDRKGLPVGDLPYMDIRLYINENYCSKKFVDGVYTTVDDDGVPTTDLRAGTEFPSPLPIWTSLQRYECMIFDLKYVDTNNNNQLGTEKQTMQIKNGVIAGWFGDKICNGNKME